MIEQSTRCCVISAGSWGTALANLLAGNGHAVTLWDRKSALLDEINAVRENKKYLPGVCLHPALETRANMKDALEGAAVAVFAVPAQHFGDVLANALPYMSEDCILVNVAKGIEQKSLRTLSVVAEQTANRLPFRQTGLPKGQVAQGRRLSYAVLSGPSHAEEVARALPTTVVVASAVCRDSTVYNSVGRNKNPDSGTAAAELIQNLFMNDSFRVYTSRDVKGLELGGALKNVIALAAGISDGMGFGDNTKAALMTRGIAEITRLGVRMGAEPETFAGLGGIGDLIVTCTSMHSRNRRCGILIGEGVSPDDATARIGMVVEGIPTAEAARALAKNLDVEMPITENVCKVVNGEITPKEALGALMTRDRKEERRV